MPYPSQDNQTCFQTLQISSKLTHFEKLCSRAGQGQQGSEPRMAKPDVVLVQQPSSAHKDVQDTNLSSTVLALWQPSFHEKDFASFLISLSLILLCKIRYFHEFMR
jgi:hypothetical protein